MGKRGWRISFGALGVMTPRLRIGIGQVPPGRGGNGLCPGKFTTEEQQLVAPAVAKAAEAVELWVTQGITACMNQYNAD